MAVFLIAFFATNLWVGYNMLKVESQELGSIRLTDHGVMARVKYLPANTTDRDYVQVFVDSCGHESIVASFPHYDHLVGMELIDSTAQALVIGTVSHRSTSLDTVIVALE